MYPANRRAGRKPASKAKALAPLVAILVTAWGQTSPPPPPIETGTLPAAWITGGPNCLEVPDWQVHEYNPSFYILRESGCTNYEKPFLFLIFGREKAMLVDTGAGESDAAEVTGKLIAKWLKREKKPSIALVVTHSHGHGDHVAGDKGFIGRPDTTFIPAQPEAVSKAFAIADWPETNGSIDLGDRVVDVIPIPGHQAAAAAYYDRKTGILLTGDNLYPGRLYISDFPAYLASTKRLVEFTESRPVAHVLGNHIEQSSTPFVDYPIGTTYQPHEHCLELGRAHLIELLDGLEKMKDHPVKLALRDFTIFPREPRPAAQKK